VPAEQPASLALEVVHQGHMLEFQPPSIAGIAKLAGLLSGNR
jgi:hypothetical protein